jgi:hypothetical protein
MVTMRGVSVAPALMTMLLYATITVVVNGSHCRAGPVLAAAAQDQEASEGQKRNAEIRKLNREADWWWLTPLVTALGAGAILWQVRTSSKDRDKNAKNEATLKLAEFVLASRTPAMAQERLNILERIDSKAFGGMLPNRGNLSLQERIVPKGKPFPAVERHELQVEVLRLIAAHPMDGKQIVEASILIFPKEKEWLERLGTLFGLTTPTGPASP